MNINKNNQERLRKSLHGHILVPGEAGYEQAVTIDNGRVKRRPAVIVVAADNQDVVLALKFAQDNELRFTVKGGGHSATGYCLNNGGLVVDLSLMNSISANLQEQSIRVQMGARWRDVYQYLENGGTDLIPIGGGCPHVGVPGFMLGGGYSFASRTYGLSVDNLMSITIVTANGDIRPIDAHAASAEEQDLWWACRGGGGGNFGIVTEMVLRVRRPRSAKMLVGHLHFPLADAQDVLGFYNDWVETLPNEMAIYGSFGSTPDLLVDNKRVKTVGMTPVFNGNFADGYELLQPLMKHSPISAQLYNLTLPQWEIFNGKTTLVQDRQAYIKAGILPPGGMNSDTVSIFEKYMQSAPSDESFIVWTHAGGEIGAIDSADTAFVHRNGRYVPELKTIWSQDKDEQENVDWACEFYAALEPHFTGSYVNYIDPLLPDWANKYYGDNYARLLAVKKYWDPENYFHFQQSVGSDFAPKQAVPVDLDPLKRTYV